MTDTAKVVKIESPSLRLCVRPHPRARRHPPKLCIHRTNHPWIIWGTTNLVRRFHVSHSEYRTNVSKATGVDLHDGIKDVDLPNMYDGALSRRESIHDASGANVGRTTDNASRRRRALPDPKPFRLPREAGPDLQTGNQSYDQSHTYVNKTPLKARGTPLTQAHRHRQKPPQEPEPHNRPLDPRTDSVLSA